MIKAPTQMMRFIDTLRYHKPTDGERSDLNMCSANERLHLHVLNDVSHYHYMCVCAVL